MVLNWSCIFWYRAIVWFGNNMCIGNTGYMKLYTVLNRRQSYHRWSVMSLFMKYYSIIAFDFSPMASNYCNVCFFLVGNFGVRSDCLSSYCELFWFLIYSIWMGFEYEYLVTGLGCGFWIMWCNCLLFEMRTFFLVFSLENRPFHWHHNEE